MSNKLDALRRRLAAEGPIRDHVRLSWLCRESFIENDHAYREDWEPLLERLARRDAATDGSSLADAWFRVAGRLASSMRDPEDFLLGIATAAYAQRCGITYPDVETYLSLLEHYRLLYVEWGRDKQETGDVDADAYAFYEFVSCRLMDIQTTLEATEEYLEDPFPAETLLADPEVVVAGARLLWDVIDGIDADLTDLGKKISDEIIEQRIDDGYWYLLACHHAKRHGIGWEPLATFLFVYQDDWFEVMEELLRRNLFRQDVVEAFCDAHATIGDLETRGPDLAAAYLAAPPENTTLTEYLNAHLTAVPPSA